uniref:hypothetical protein n=1 Tax=Alloprevotella sp. TaxID=1872471 RepID=UPI00402584A1
STTCCCRGLQTRPPQLGRHTAVYLFYRITSVEKMKVLMTFILFFARLALLCYAKLGGGSEEKMKVLRTFILFFARLALTLHPKDLT